SQAKTATNKLFPRTGSVIDKIRADFSPKKDEPRILALNFSDSGGMDMESWSEVFTRIKECVVTGFNGQITHYEEDVRRLDAQRMMPGWNYCTFFILKEKMVRAFQMMGMYDEALKQYDELEAAFFQVLKDRTLSWFSSFGGTTPGDDNTNLLDFGKKNYRELILQNKITVFDFRMYLFGRQCQLLIQLQKTREFLERARKFVPSFKHAMREFEKGLSPIFLSAWTFSTCKNVVDVCESIPTDPVPTDAHESAEIAAIKAEFLGNARIQLDTLGIHFSVLPKSLESTVLPSSASLSRPHREAISNPELTHGLEQQANFDNLYVTITNKAIRYCEDCKRFRFAQALRSNLANL
ncbi:hypothetical protein BJ085DRAFT_12357, partial [Dimargaris cristalligena]